MPRSTRPTIAGILTVLVLAGCAAGAPSPALPRSTPTAMTDSTPVPTEVPAQSPTAPGPKLLGREHVDDAVAPGPYRVAAPFGAPFSLSFPSEWTLKDLEPGDVEFANSARGDQGVAWLVVDLVENVFADPCHASHPSDPPVARTVDEVVAALASMEGFQAGSVTDVTVGGYAGKALEITNTIDTDTTVCAGDRMLPMWTFTGGGAAQTNGGATEQLWVVDVDGAPVIIDGETFAGTPSGSKEEIREIVSTLRFE